VLIKYYIAYKWCIERTKAFGSNGRGGCRRFQKSRRNVGIQEAAIREVVVAVRAQEGSAGVETSMKIWKNQKKILLTLFT